MPEVRIMEDIEDLKKRLRKKKRQKEIELDEGDYPVHEKYTKEEPVKEG